jgi:hypothetical protein
MTSPSPTGEVPATAPMSVTGRSNVASPQFRKKAQLQFPELFLEQSRANVFKQYWKGLNVRDKPFSVLQPAFERFNPLLF